MNKMINKISSLHVDKWYIISWICIIYAFAYDFIGIPSPLKRYIAGICFLYIVIYSIITLKKHKK